MSPCDRPRTRRGAATLYLVDADGPGENPEPEQVFQLMLPRWRVEQLCGLADHVGTLATAMVKDWVIERLDEQDFEDGLPPLSAVTESSAVATGQIVRLPVYPALND